LPHAILEFECVTGLEAGYDYWHWGQSFGNTEVIAKSKLNNRWAQSSQYRCLQR